MYVSFMYSDGDWAEWSGQWRVQIIENMNINEPRTKLNNLEKSK